MTATKAIRSIDMRLIEDLFEMGSGYVLDFSNRTFAEFFHDDLGVDIYETRYEVQGTSKANRLRFFLRNSNPDVRIRTLKALWEYRQAARRRQRLEEVVPDAEEAFHSLLERLGGRKPSTNPTASVPQARTTIDPVLCGELKAMLMEVSQLDPQPRGYAYERFLKKLFDVNGLEGRASYRLVGEQIDGSFELSGETYLLEAKWQGSPTGAAELLAFNGKVEAKAAWSRGLFVSESGFSEDGLNAFGRGKRVICMDGLDLYQMLEESRSFADVVAKKVRRAAESGNPFVRVRDLYI